MNKVSLDSSFKNVALPEFEDLLALQSDKSLSNSDKVRYMVLKWPSCMEWNEAKFAWACGVNKSDVSKVFCKVITEDQPTNGACYPARLFQFCDGLIRSHQSNNYLDRIIAKHTAQLKDAITMSIQQKFNPECDVKESYDDIIIDGLMELDSAVEIQETDNFHECFLSLLKDEATFSMTQIELAKKITHLTGNKCSNSNISKFLKGVFKEKGTLWPNRKMRNWETKIKEAIRRNDPYMMEKYRYYNGMKQEVIATIRERCFNPRL